MTSTKRVHFRAPERLIRQADAIATAEDRNRTDVIVEALQAYLADATDEDRVKQAIADAYYEGELDFAAVKAVVGVEEAMNLRVLKRQLTDDTLSEELAAALDE